MHADRRINEILYREFAPEGDSPVAVRMRKGMQVGLEMMPYARFRPVTFVGQRLWDEHIRAYERATLRQASPEQALGDAQRIVQVELDTVFERERNPFLNTGAAVGASAAAVLALLALFVGYCRREGRVAPLLRSEARAGYLFALPWLVGFLGFFLGPMIASVVFSLCDYDVLHPARWVGGQNYARLAQDPMLGKAFFNIFFLSAIAIPAAMAISLGLAMLLNARVNGMPLYRTAFYLPSLTPVVAVAIVWLFILNPDSGVINQTWRATLTAWFGIPAPAWLSSEQWSKPALVLVSLWGVGNTIILWLAGLQGVPQHLYEAADLDGAGPLHRFRHVTLPMLTPYILFNLIMGTIAWLQRFTDIYIMTDGNGGPVDSTMVPILYLFANAFSYFKMGYASAWAWLIFAVVMALTALNLWGSKRWVHYEGERK
jgi:multiple sugar transport system permease protein